MTYKPISTRAAASIVALLVGAWLAGCHSGSTPAVAAWRADCPPLEQPVGLNLDAARAAQRWAERRHELRLREAAAPGTFLRSLRTELDADRIAAGQVCLTELADLGQLLFEHEYNFPDGLGNGAAATASAGPFRRVHNGAFGGPETLSCPSCHWVGGPNGAGAETDNAFLLGDGDRIASGDARNPPALVALGVVQALAHEMSGHLQQQRTDLVRAATHDGAARETHLLANGVDFGVLRASAKGELDTSGVRGIDPDLILKPFGWKGTLARIADFADDGLQVHLGIQSDGLLAGGARESMGTGKDPADPDGDGVRNELSRGPFSAMIVHLTLLELPVIRLLVQDRQFAPAARGLLAPTTTSFADEFAYGREQFHALGCAGCHAPMMVLKNPVVTLDGMPPIDLSQQMREPKLRYDATLGGYPVWLFSDLKRHDMGNDNVAQHVQRGVARNEYLTPRLWAVANSAPYLHDGRAPSLDYAIAGHDGEGAAARTAYAALSPDAKGALRIYLMSLRRAPRVIVP